MERITKHTISVQKTARFYTIGEANSHTESVWFVLHGYGQLANYFIRHFEAIDNGKRLIVAPEALSRLYVGDDYKRAGASWMTKVEREAEIADYLQYLNGVADHITERFDGSPPPITVLGFSQGATTASRWVTLGGLPADRLLLWAGPLAHDLDFATYAPTLNAMQPTFIVGDKDYFITPERLEKEKALMAAHNLDITYVPFSGEHRLNKAVLKTLVAD